MTAVALVFWISVGCIAYTYVGYPILLILVSSLQQVRSDWRFISGAEPRRITADHDLPAVAVLVAAFNEESHIADRINNILAQDYPADRLRIYVGSDASDDRTAEIARSVHSSRLVFADFAERRGKASVINDLAAMASEEILILTDANTVFAVDTVKKLTRHFQQESVGCVCGELRLLSSSGQGDNQDHVYWRYERMLKFFESRIGGLLGANGGVYALRRDAYRSIPANTIVDDFWLSMQTVEAGLRCVYDPEAVASETTPSRIADEFRRRVRIGMGNYQALTRFVGMLDPRRGAIAFTFLSHKCLRWLVPHLMAVALVCNVMLAGSGPYLVLLCLQLFFYAGAGVAWRCSRTGSAPRLLRLPLFFVSMNAGLLVGFWRYLTVGTSGVWARSAR